MSTSGTWLDLADWELRARDFGELREYDDGRPIVAMSYSPFHPDREWGGLLAQWLELSPHPHVLDALDRDQDQLLLRYAAFDWNHPLMRVDASWGARQVLAEWGVQLTDAYLSLLGEVPESETRRFLRPVIHIDLGRAARLAFLPVTAADVVDSRVDERSFVRVIGVALRAYCSGLDGEEAEELASILDRCVAPDPNRRFRTLHDLRAAWKHAGGRNAVRKGEKLAAWTLAEEGLGWMVRKRLEAAIRLFEEALELDPGLAVAVTGVRRASDMLGTPGRFEPTPEGWSFRRPPPLQVPAPISWAEAQPEGQKLEAERAFSDAVRVYGRVTLDKTNDASVFVAISRCQLALGAGALAVDYAQRALAVQSKHPEAMSLRARGYLLQHRYEDALKCAALWLIALGEDATAHYVRGRALLGLSRYFDAREAFDRACALQPTMLEAMLLRREAERAAARVREEVGEQPELRIDVPDHLSHVRDALAAGRIDEVISLLDRPEYERDASAKLIQAQCLAFERRLGEALAMYDRALALSSEHEHAVALGKAHALLELHQAEDALVLFELALARNGGDLDALEGRALALRQLGREDEAEQALGRLYAASTGR